MAWKKSSVGLIERFKAALPEHPEAEPKKMFGYEACFVKGNFFVGLHEESCVVRLPDGLRDRFAELAKAPGFDPMGNGKGMKDWFVIPPSITKDGARLAKLVGAMFTEVVKLPPKAAKPKKAKPTAAQEKTKTAKKTPAR